MGQTRHAQTRRERQHEATSEEIKHVARQQMQEQGTAGISLRAIANQMDLTAPALYRYYANRDELITALILDAYNALADALVESRKTHIERSYGEQMFAMLMRYRNWAKEHHTEFTLIAGNPIPGYHAPFEVTQPAAQRAFIPFLMTLQAAWEQGQLHIPQEYSHLPEHMNTELVGWRSHLSKFIEHLDLPTPFLCIILLTWGKIHGLIFLQLYEHLQAIIADTEELYKTDVLVLLHRLGLTLYEADK